MLWLSSWAINRQAYSLVYRSADKQRSHWTKCHAGHCTGREIFTHHRLIIPFTRPASTAGFFTSIARQHRTHQAARINAYSPVCHLQVDQPYSATLANPQHDKISLSQTKTALHRTRLQVLHHKNFSVFIFLQRAWSDRAGAGFMPEYAN